MTNLLFEDRQSSYNLKMLGATFMAFITLLFALGTYFYTIFITFFLLVYIFTALITRWFIKRSILPQAGQVNAFKRPFKLGFEQYGILKAAYGQLVFVGLNGKTDVLMDTATFQSKLHLNIISPVTDLHLKTVEIRKGIHRYRLPFEIWNELYDQLPAFKVNVDDYKIYKQSTQVIILIQFLVAFSPILIKVALNFISKKPVLAYINTLDLLFTGIYIILSLISVLRDKIRRAKEKDDLEIDALDPYRLLVKEVKGFEDI